MSKISGFSLLFSLSFILILLNSCGSKDVAPDVSNIDINVTIERTEQAIFNTKSQEDFTDIINKNLAFYELYFERVLGLEADSSASYYSVFNDLAKDSLFVDLNKAIAEKYNNLQDLQSQMNKMYQYLEYYFPERIAVPKIFTFVSDFAYQMFEFDDNGQDGLALGLDMFLSPDINYKSVNPDNTNFSDYLTRSWNGDHIIQKVAQIHITDLAGESPGQRMIDQMIFNGKMLYMTKKILPFVHDTIIHEYSFEQLKWCEGNQFEILQFFLENKLFYETNLKKISKYIYPAPTSLDMPPSSPGRTANFLGYKIVEAYMKRYPDTTLDELIALYDSQMIMDKSKYKPRIK